MNTKEEVKFKEPLTYDDILYLRELQRQKKEVWFYDPCGKEKDGTLERRVEKL
jgi:hypothetical protein